MPKFISWSSIEHEVVYRQAGQITFSTRRIAFCHSSVVIITITFFFAGDIAIYSNLLLAAFLPFYFWLLFFLMLPPRDSYFKQVTSAKTFLSFWVEAAGLQSQLALLFSWPQAVGLTTDNYHNIKETWSDQTNPIPQFPKQLGLICHRDGSRKSSFHAKDDR